MVVIETKNHASGDGCAPMDRPIRDYVMNGVINLDKPANPSSHEVVAWTKRVLNAVGGQKIEKTGHSGTLDPKVTGTLIVAIDNATKLVKMQQSAGKEYVAILKLHDKVPGGKAQIERALETMTGTLFQRPPLISAVKRVLRTRTIYEAKLRQYVEDTNMVVFWVSCEAGTYIRTLCVHLGLILGVGGHMLELRRVRSGAMKEGIANGQVTLHNVIDAGWRYKVKHDERALRHVIQPLEVLLIGMPRIMIKDSSVASVTHGGQLMVPGVLRFDDSIKMGQEIVIITVKGEAVAIAVAILSSTELQQGVRSGTVCKTKRVILSREAYTQKWGKGPHAQEKQRQIAAGKIGKHEGHTFYNDKKPGESNVQAAEAVKPSNGKKRGAAELEDEDEHEVEEVEEAEKQDELEKSVVSDVSTKSKSKGKHDDETAEERAARKLAKAEKKAAKAALAASKAGAKKMLGS